MTFAWIDRHRQESPDGGGDVALACEVLGVSRSGYYAWRRRRLATSPRELRRRELAGRIRAAHADSRGTYGSPRVTAELNGRGACACARTRSPSTCAKAA